MLDRSNIEITNPIYLPDDDEDEMTAHDGESDAFNFNHEKSVRNSSCHTYKCELGEI